jgi:hypothetical protein
MRVIKIRFYIALSLLISVLFVDELSGQVFPGDADNNGIVNHLDVLNIGFAFNTYGPARIESGGPIGNFTIPLLWEENFPQGLNFAFADADGSGLIDFLDLAVVSSNYGEINPNGSEIITFYPGIPLVHSPLTLDKSDVPGFLTGGSSFEIPIFLGNEDLPLNEFSGIAFTIEYDAEYIVEIEFTLEEDSWINEGDGVFKFQANENVLGQKDITISRYGQSPVSGEGKIGTLSLIVIDDLVSLLPAPTDSSNVIVNIKNIKSVNAEFWTVPIVSDSVNIMVYGPDALPTSTKQPTFQELKIYPNPSKDYFEIESPVPMNRVEVVDAFGKTIRTTALNGQYFYQTESLRHYAPGLYIVKIYTKKGIESHKVIIKRE